VKALSIRQPWAWLIIHAGKNIENRTWATNYRGRILVHASKGMTLSEYMSAQNTLDTAKEISPSTAPWANIELPKFEELERGGFVGLVNIVDCVDESQSPWFFGPKGFVLAKPQPMPFSTWKGRLGFFDVPFWES
jgi:hypothetical protein